VSWEGKKGKKKKEKKKVMRKFYQLSIISNYQSFLVDFYCGVGDWRRRGGWLHWHE